MEVARERLAADIEAARIRLDESMETRQNYEEVYRDSVKLDQLIELYIASGF
ncbi:MAG: Spo0E family sporulation regulatory protein-aspartic acid phosphatase [Clostridiales bacterium]|nr:Spo0E family sporulation regulatory protein-aspartic acid phosphatase [Clostridiales bacterium]